MKIIILIYLLLSSINLEKTKVSWYGPGFDGKLTANGEIFSQDSLTAASPNLPFNTMIEITNPDNNKSVIVRINDRGPFKCYVDINGNVKAYRPLEPHQDRDFDLSKKAFETIADIDKGVIKIEYKIL